MAFQGKCQPGAIFREGFYPDEGPSRKPINNTMETENARPSHDSAHRRGLAACEGIDPCFVAAGSKESSLDHAAFGQHPRSQLIGKRKAIQGMLCKPIQLVWIAFSADSCGPMGRKLTGRIAIFRDSGTID